MKKKKQIIILYFFVASILIIATYMLSNHTWLSKGLSVDYKNFPYELRSQMSTLIDRTSVIALYGKPDIARNSFDRWHFSDGSYLFATYSDDRLTDLWRIKKLLKTSAFSHIIVGKSLESDVRKVDPYCLIYEDTPGFAFSEHRLSDGGFCTIRYIRTDMEWQVDSIIFKSIDPSGFLKNLSFFERILLLQ